MLHSTILWGRLLLLESIVVGIISFYLKETPSFIIISINIILSTTLDFYQEYKATNIIESLKKYVDLKCVAIREGQKRNLRR